MKQTFAGITRFNDGEAEGKPDKVGKISLYALMIALALMAVLVLIDLPNVNRYIAIMFLAITAFSLIMFLIKLIWKQEIDWLIVGVFIIGALTAFTYHKALF